MRSSDSTPVRLAVSGAPVVGQTLARLLQGSRYDARFVPASSLAEPGSLKGVQVLLLTPLSQLGSRHREALLASLEGEEDGSSVTTGVVPVLELATSSEESRDEEAWGGAWRAVPWPCSIDELKRNIEDALLAVSGGGPDEEVRQET